MAESSVLAALPEVKIFQWAPVGPDAVVFGAFVEVVVVAVAAVEVVVAVVVAAAAEVVVVYSFESAGIATRKVAVAACMVEIPYFVSKKNFF
jgi:hypothetical protein